jgi:uncharacterized protein YndB with AHSA1/START domain
MHTSIPTFTFTKTFRASQTQVFEAFANAEALAQWWGPVEAPIEVVSLDFKPGGHFHYKMIGQQINYGLFKYLQIDAPHSIEWINSFADAAGNVIKPPFEGLDFPKEIVNKITLTEVDGITTLQLVSTPLNATENELSTFSSFTESMQQGFGGTLNQLEAYLQSIQ